MQVAPAELGGSLLSADIRLVIGTRPEAIKLAPVARALAARDVRPSLILTGQHADLDPVDHGLGAYPATRLYCPGTQDPHSHVQSVAAAVLTQLRRPPDLLVVQGDTSSALGGALAGFTAAVPVAHVEAGLRSHDSAMPWPEEEYRTAIDAHSDLLFAPTALAAANLREEGVAGAIFVTGNTGIDAVLKTRAELPPPSLCDRALPRLLVTCHRRENWGERLASVALALRQLAQEGTSSVEVVLHPNPHVSGTIERLLGGCFAITLVPPCSQRRLVAMMRDCDLMLSDSGGVQEEASALGVPLLVLREKTERPEAIWSGNMRLVGTDTAQILAEVRDLLGDPVALAAMANPSLPYGDGRAGYRIAALIEHWLSGRFAADSPRQHPSAEEIRSS
ncbi:UDP-N-acetylglucosamine 2-epimerase (non-hydrolyzing) [Sphingomonas sp.]|uniref:non-hydrolyzing UDP-N-acetylglucosamine 2-epimerase n=1 Tax=Sphingomonas sp. TaxID=28214 RepID=UPI0018103404|nr:UDP-N-acetylglucosamine 2-epimerase (non-hydrolyzing) [Sphingomonas sp.]MBA3511975.1 UDP-N-acetylglucosamine 2-epimerase (non-hydrolyzing) [Sphingomonas sp.]